MFYVPFSTNCELILNAFLNRPDMTFTVEWTLNTNYLSIYLPHLVFYMFVRSYVAVSKAKFAENVHIVSSSPE